MIQKSFIYNLNILGIFIISINTVSFVFEICVNIQANIILRHFLFSVWHGSEIKHKYAFFNQIWCICIFM